jgi:hypothetical protein
MVSSVFAGDCVGGVAAEDGGVGAGWLWRGWGVGCEVGEVGCEGVVDLVGDRSFEAADDVGLAFALGGAALGVGLGAGAASEAVHGDHVERAVGLAVAAGVEAVAVGFA